MHTCILMYVRACMYICMRVCMHACIYNADMKTKGFSKKLQSEELCLHTQQKDEGPTP